MKYRKGVSAIDLFCGIGGLTHGLQQANIKVKVGIDQDESCRYPYTANNDADFIQCDIEKVDGLDLLSEYWHDEDVKILVGCAPCQPFSTHSNKIKGKKDDKKWTLLFQFLKLIKETDPQIISMENVPNLANKDIFDHFVKQIQAWGYSIYFDKIYCPDYGVPQKRRRLVLLASKYGPISLMEATHNPEDYKTTFKAIGGLDPIKAGQTHPDDPIHRSRKLSNKNIERIKHSSQNGTWEDWPEELLLPCHKKKSGKTYKAVYGRMSWSEPSSTITTQFYNYGTGRFGHPEQDRALSVREGAILQTFPKNYIFIKSDDDFSMTKIGRHIGNAVPVELGKVIGKSILEHLDKHLNYEHLQIQHLP